MDAPTIPDAYGVLTEAATLKIQRLLPGPIERVWAWLTQSELRRQWLAAGHMEMKAGAHFELVWRNDELTDPPGERPPGFPEEHRAECRIVELDPPRKLVFIWAGNGEVSFELDPQGDKVLLTVTHRGLSERATRLMVGAGWHTHLDILVDRSTGRASAPYWDDWSRLRNEYNRRLPV